MPASDPNKGEENENSRSPSKSSSSASMFSYLRELLLLLAFIFSSYATFFNSVPKVGKAPDPSPFFPTWSVVHDYYRGSMGGAFEQANKADLAVVMFYAPWDAESQAARPVIDAVARFLKDEVYLCAVSCWAPSMDCKQHYPKIRSFPVIVAYPQQGPGIPYKGPLTTAHLVRFIKALLKPVQRIHTQQDIIKMFDSYAAVVVGSFDFEGNLGGRGYFVFYSTALKILEHDFSHDIGFAVTTNTEDAARLGVEQVPSIRLYRWNDTIDYSLNEEYTEDAVSTWVIRNVIKPIQWLHLPKTKATTLSNYVTVGPALVVFTPGNPLLPYHPVYSQLREISLRYFYCTESQWRKEQADSLQVLNRGLQSKYQRQELACGRMRQAKMLRDRNMSVFASSVITATALSNRTDCDAPKKIMGPHLEVCVRPTDNPSNNSSKKIRYDTSMLDSEVDELGAQSLLEVMQKDVCKILDAAQAHQRIWSPQVYPEEVMKMEGLACTSNRTLSFVLLDSLIHYQIAEGLGLNVLDMPEKTAAVIIDAKAEAHYLMKEPLSQASLVQFILNFTEGVLERQTRSTHDADSRSLTKHSYPILPEASCRQTDTESCIPELHSRNFLPTVMDPTKAVIVLYHSPLCAICRSVSHIMLLLARYFRHFPHLRFVRIDGERNDLPWGYTMESYPTVLFFPTTQKDESRVLSEHLPFTVQTLMHFILANLEPEAKVPAMMSLCKSFDDLQTKEEASSCKYKVQVQIQEGLSSSLRRMRSVLARWASASPESHAATRLHRQKTKIMRSLQYFRSAGFVLGSIDRAGKGINNVLELYQKFLSR